MKKSIILALALILCLSLCACGGMSGEEAALLYPDIIGKWGNDPFGEEFVLELSGDGSCSILGNEGTWTLDSKNSNEEWVELTVKTEAMKYYVELDRVQDGRKTVHLWIADIKRETTVNEGYVFLYGNQYVFSELALQAVPELVGEWGSAYWNEEPVLTVNEDGTCTLLRQSGKWCLWAQASTWPDLEMIVKLENSLQYSIEFSLDTDLDWGYPCAQLRIFDISDETYIWSDPETEWPIFSVIDRKQVIHPMDYASIIVGEWCEDGKEQSFATFYEDGTCTIRGADGLWALDYTAYYNEKYRNGWDYCLYAMINGDEYNIRFNSPDDNGKCSMYILNQDDNIYILDSSVIKVDAG